MKWYQDYDFIFAQFEKGDERVDEITWDELVLISIGGISADDWEKSWFD